MFWVCALFLTFIGIVSMDMWQGKWGEKAAQYGFFALHPSLTRWWDSDACGGRLVRSVHRIDLEELPLLLFLYEDN